MAEEHDQEMMNEIEEMSAALGADGNDELEETPEAEEPPEETEEGSEEGSEGEEVEEEPTEEKADPTDILLAKLEAMEARLAKLTEGERAEKKEPPPAEPEMVDFLEGATIEDIAGDEGKFNELLNKIYRKARTDSKLEAQEAVLKSLPELIKTGVEQQSTLTTKANKFYKDNPDLKPFRKAVGLVAQEVAGEHPEWTVDKVFAETEKEARRRLNLKKKAAVGDGKPRGFAKGTGSRGGESKEAMTELQREIAEMDKAGPY